MMKKKLSAMGVRFIEGGEGVAAGSGPERPADTVVAGGGAGSAQAETPTRNVEAPNTGEGTNRVGEHGYPENTRVDDMTPTDQAAYWRHKARRHEQTWKQVRDRNLSPEQVISMQDELDKLNRERMDERERAIDDARREASQQAREAVLPQLVLANITAAVARRNPGMSDDDIQARVEFLDLKRFITDKGDVDTAKVSVYASTIAPAADGGGGVGGGKFPDMGGGKRGQSTQTAKERARMIATERGYVAH